MRALSALALLLLASAGLAQPPGPFGQPNGLGGFGQPSGKGTFAAPIEKVRWEYAELAVRTLPSFAKDGDEKAKATQTIRWTTDKEETTYTSYADFAGKVKMDGFKQDAPATHQRIQVLNHLGNEGWELVESTSNTSGPPNRTMLFKRRAR